MVEAWQVSGETVEAFCKRQGISRESLKRWRHRRGVGTGEAFMPVAVIRSPTAPATSPCVVLVGERIRIECGEHTDEGNLAKAIRAAVAACGQICGQ